MPLSYTEAHHSHLQLVDRKSRVKLDIAPGVPRGDQPRRTGGETWLFDMPAGDKINSDTHIASLAQSVIGALSMTYKSVVNPERNLRPGTFYASPDLIREVHETAKRFGRLLQNSDSIVKPFSELSDIEKDKLIDLYDFLFNADAQYSLYTLYMAFMQRMEIPVPAESLMIVRE